MSDEAETDGAGTGRGFGVAYAFLNRRERTVAEVRARLERAEIPAEEIDAVVAELLEFGYLDDARYARVFTQDKRTLDAWGNERIARALRERGVDRDLIQAALAEDADGDGAGGSLGLGGADVGLSGADVGLSGTELGLSGTELGLSGADVELGGGAGLRSELARAVALLGQRFPAGPADSRDRERAFGVLARKGYESETAADAVREWARRDAM